MSSYPEHDLWSLPEKMAPPYKSTKSVTHLIQNQKKKLEEAYSLQIYWLMKKTPLRNWKSTIAFQIAFIATDEHLFVTNLAQNWQQKDKA